MEYTITPSPDRQYMILEVVGDFTRARAFELAQDAFSRARRLGIRCALTDMIEAHNIDTVVGRGIDMTPFWNRDEAIEHLKHAAVNRTASNL